MKIERGKTTFFFLFYEIRQTGKEGYHCEDDPAGGVDEGGRLNEQQRSGGDESEHGETQHAKRLREIGTVSKAFVHPEIGATNAEHDDEAGQNNGCRGQHASPDTCGGVTDISGAVDADRSRRDLTDGHYIDEFLLAHPAMTLHFHLYQ